MTQREPRQFYLEEIEVGERIRALHEPSLAALTESVKVVGMQTAISVRIVKDDRGETLMLVAGLHRLEVARRLGMERIEARIVDMDERQAKMWEIAENLHRAELTEPERRQHIAQWVSLVAERVRHSDAPLPGGAQPNELGIRKAAKELGLSEAAVRRAVGAESLPDDVKAAAADAEIGTVKRAAISREPSAEAQLAAIRRENDAAEARKQARDDNRFLAERRIDEVKDWLERRLNATEIHDLGMMLAGVFDPLSRSLMKAAAV